MNVILMNTEETSVLWGGTRNFSIDLIKTVTILFVVWGHMIQYLHGSEYDFWSNWIFKWIYGFHMPLFAMISGFLYSKSKKVEVSTAIKRKVKQLLLPIVSWAFVLSILDCFINIILHKANGAGVFFHRFMARSMSDLWFLKGIFICFVIVLILETICNSVSIRFFLLTVVSLTTVIWPNTFGFHLYGFLVPYYCIGYIIGLCNNVKNEKSFSTYCLFSGTKSIRCITFLSLTTAYFCLLSLYQSKHYIYITGLSIFNSVYGIWGQLEIDLFRFIIGLTGCLMIIVFCCIYQVCIPRRLIDKVITVSSSTLIIYTISASMFVYLRQLLLRLSITNIWTKLPDCVVDILLLLPLSIFLSIFCIFLGRFFSRTKLTSLLIGK